ncbi:TonB family protein [Sphingobacterium sp. LRF_L2]|uniref:energy transducer TonB n=1 Tax=Sphingobacterium sp. LRF_L2 TaxID=3369421 RepID=UPI003F6073DF
MKAYIFFTFSFLLFFSTTSAQYLRVSYYDKDGKEITDKEESFFYRIIATDDKSPNLFKYLEYYTKGDTQKTIATLKNERTTHSKVGEALSYYPNGQLFEKEYFSDNHTLIDSSYTYYENGILFMKRLHKSKAVSLTQEGNKPSSSKNEENNNSIEYLLVQDSLGNILAKNGNGILVITDLLNKNRLTEQGPILNNQKNGEWKGSFKTYSYEEEWEEGKLIRGITKDSTGAETTYDEDNYEIMPEYPGGYNALRMFVANNYQYPNRAIRAGVSGTIQIEFIVNKDGSMSDFKIRNDLGFGTGDAAIRALKMAQKKWRPGVQRGRAVRVAYTLPITLNLSR